MPKPRTRRLRQVRAYRPRAFMAKSPCRVAAASIRDPGNGEAQRRNADPCSGNAKPVPDRDPQIEASDRNRNEQRGLRRRQRSKRESERDTTSPEHHDSKAMAEIETDPCAPHRGGAA